jgi:hypothetical protein
MKESQVKVAREKKTLSFFHEAIMENIFQVYLLQFPDKNRATLQKEILAPMRRAKVSGDELIEQAYASGGGVTSYQLLLIACAYWVESGMAYSEKRFDAAWSCAMESMAYFGGAKYSDSFDRALPILQEEIGQHVMASKGAVGGANRNDPFQKIAAEAVRLIKHRGEQGETWSSYTEAAKAVLDDLQETIKLHIKHFTAEDGGLRTIAGRLCRAHEIEQYILQRRGRPPKK